MFADATCDDSTNCYHERAYATVGTTTATPVLTMMPSLPAKTAHELVDDLRCVDVIGHGVV